MVYFRPQYAEQSLMKSAIKTSEESWIEQQMLEDKKRATDWEATNEAIEEQVARESYLQWLQDQEKQARQVWRGCTTSGSQLMCEICGVLTHTHTHCPDLSTINIFTFSPVRPAPPAARRRRRLPADSTTGAPGRHGNATPIPPTLTSQPPLQPTTSPPPPPELPSS